MISEIGRNVKALQKVEAEVPLVSATRGSHLVTGFSLAASVATIVALVYAGVSLGVSEDAAQREAITQTFDSTADICLRNPIDGFPSADLKVDTVITNTGRLPITVIAVYGSNRKGQAKYAGVYLEQAAAPFVNRPFRLEIGQAVALSTEYVSTASESAGVDAKATTDTVVLLSSGKRVTATFRRSDGTPNVVRVAYKSANALLGTCHN